MYWPHVYTQTPVTKGWPKVSRNSVSNKVRKPMVKERIDR